MAGTQSMLPFPYLNTYIEAICFKISSNSLIKFKLPHYYIMDLFQLVC